MAWTAGGSGLAWKRAALHENAVVLDLASGTGDFSHLVARRLPAARAIAVDLTEGMLRVARARGLRERRLRRRHEFAFRRWHFRLRFHWLRAAKFSEPGDCAAGNRAGHAARRLVGDLGFFSSGESQLCAISTLAICICKERFGACCCTADPRTYTYIPDSLRNFVSIDEFSCTLQRMGYELLDTRRVHLRRHRAALGGQALAFPAKLRTASKLRLLCDDEA